MTATLAEFLMARIAEDEGSARDAQQTGDGWWHDGDGEVWSHMQLVSHPTMLSHADHIARHDPARVLAECGAKRQILEQWETREASASDLVDRELELTIRFLAAVYADHPDYRAEWEEWAP